MQAIYDLMALGLAGLEQTVIPAWFAKCRLPTRADIRAFGPLGSLNEQGWPLGAWQVSDLRLRKRSVVS